MIRTHTCGELGKSEAGQEVILTGWVHRRRDHGGVIFIDLRDRYGLTQIKFDPEINKEALKIADSYRSEWVVKAKGMVVERPADMVNHKMKTGEIEVEVFETEVLSESKTPPFELDEEKSKEANEAIRLKYRFVDLRREKLQKMLSTRHKFIRHIRDYFERQNFLEVQTPILANSSPEGARDFLVPSRLHPGTFYALPQAPQQFKQLLMVGGVDKYFQIAPCFRDEDPRADRHPGEFYQVDLEMSYANQEDVWEVTEKLMTELTENFSDKKIISKPFPRITYHEVMEKYGSDKPDIRFDMPIKPITELVAQCGFSVFSKAAEEGGVVHALRVEGGAKFSRREIDELTDLARSKEAKGLAYITVKEGGELASPILKFLEEDTVKNIVDSVGAKEGDIVFFGADKWRVVCESLGAVRDECGERLGLKDPKKAAWLWVHDYPMYDYSEFEEGKIDFSHNPFSMPQGGMEVLENKDPLEIKAYQYDLVVNGYEISSGAIRNHRPDIMYKAFEIAGYSKQDVDKKFGGMIKAFQYGAPPHGGIAPGLDRLLMVLLDGESIRDIYAFPKDGQARDAMMDSPSEVEEKQLREVHIKLRKND